MTAVGTTSEHPDQEQAADDGSTSPCRRRSVRIGGILIEYDDRVLTPRPWTVLQSMWAAELLETAPPGPVLELCSGAGHIGLVAAAATGRRLVAVDADEAACSFIALNAEAADLAHRVEVRNESVGAALAEGESFVLVIADPPWVCSAETSRFPEDPLVAIDGGDDGLGVARECVAVAARALDPGRSLLLQLGNDEQAAAICTEALHLGWDDGGRRAGAGGLVLRLVRT